MNDFTKEELEQILFDIDEKTWAFDENHISIEYRKLRQKVSDMIENYCEHEYENCCCGCTDAISCSKCDKRLI